uniref:Putative ovule protein n=1 Tax=Solanum chacoense TaxID=4108 RepID=A0A0V0I195_SOLCH
MSSAFCAKNDSGEFVYSDTRTTWDVLVTEVEVIAMRMGIEFCVAQSFLPITLETDSLALKNIVDRVWEVPWTISMEVKKISLLREKVLKLVEVTQILREGNKVTVFFANIVFLCRYKSC